MAVKIRLRRMGAKKRPFYRLVVADARSPRDGRFIEAVGTYDPLANPAVVKINAERVKEWMSQGARPTDTARQLLVAEGLLERTTREYPQVEKKPKLNKKAIARAAAEAQAPPEAPAGEAEAPAPETEAPAAEAEAPASEPEAAAEPEKAAATTEPAAEARGRTAAEVAAPIEVPVAEPEAPRFGARGSREAVEEGGADHC